MKVADEPRVGAEPTPAKPAKAERDWLNPIDRIILLAQRALREVKQPGWPIQTHVWLAGRVDVAQLQQGLDRLNRRFPVVTSRVCGDCQHAYWEPRPEATPLLHEVHLESSEQADVLRFAEQLLVQPVDLDRCDPISFHLLHLPDGRDVFIFQYDHVLMDANATVPVLKEISRLATTTAAPDHADESVPPLTDEFEQYLGRFSLWQRWCAVWWVCVEGWRRRKKLPVTLGESGGDVIAAPTLAVRIIPADQCAAIAANIQKVTGVPSLSMAVLGSAFRAIRKFTTQSVEPNSLFAAMLGAKLRRLSSSQSPSLFHNLFGLLVPVVTAADLTDRDQALRAVSDSLRERLAKRADLGGLIIAKCLRLNTRSMARHARRACHEVGDNSLRYGFFGSLAAKGETFCGVEITLAYKTALGMPPWGMLLWVNQSCGELVLSAVYQRPMISDELAQQFLDYICADLVA